MTEFNILFLKIKKKNNKTSKTMHSDSQDDNSIVRVLKRRINLKCFLINSNAKNKRYNSEWFCPILPM